MSWTYLVADLATSPRDQLRLTLGDTNPQNPLLQDEEIALAISQRSSIVGAAANCCRWLATRFSLQCDASAGDTKMMYSQIAKSYMTMAWKYDLLAASTGSGNPIVGGISEFDVENNENDADRVSPDFARNQFDSNIPTSQRAPLAPDLTQE